MALLELIKTVIAKHTVKNDCACTQNIVKLHIFQSIVSKHMNSLIIFPLIQNFNIIGSKKKNPDAII